MYRDENRREERSTESFEEWEAISETFLFLPVGYPVGDRFGTLEIYDKLVHCQSFNWQPFIGQVVSSIFILWYYWNQYPVNDRVINKHNLWYKFLTLISHTNFKVNFDEKLTLSLICTDVKVNFNIEVPCLHFIFREINLKVDLYWL